MAEEDDPARSRSYSDSTASAVAAISDKTYSVTPDSLKVKSGIVAGDLTEMKVTERVEGDGGRIRAGLLRHEFGARALRPDAELLGRSGAEGVTGGPHHLATLAGKAVGQLADGRGLARAVDAHDQDHEGAVFPGDLESPGHGLQHRHDFLAQRPDQCLDVRELVARDALAQFLEQFFRDLHADVERLVAEGEAALRAVGAMLRS